MTMEKAGHSRAGMIATSLLVVAGLATPASADTRPTYDKRIEEAAISRLVPKLGDIRGSLELGANTHVAPVAAQPFVENKPVDIPAQSPRSRSKGSFLFF